MGLNDPAGQVLTSDWTGLSRSNFQSGTVVMMILRSQATLSDHGDIMHSPLPPSSLNTVTRGDYPCPPPARPIPALTV